MYETPGEPKAQVYAMYEKAFEREKVKENY